MKRINRQSNATFNEFRNAIKHLLDEDENLTLVWQHDKLSNSWKARLITNNGIITTTLIEYLQQYNVGIHVSKGFIYLYH